MRCQTYILRLVTPGFLGDAAQRGEWRTPPLKAALRQWWRLLWFATKAAKGKNPSVGALRQREGETFGHAWLKTADGGSWFVRSPLRLALERWQPGTMAALAGESTVNHANVRMPVGALLYAGYGPLVSQERKTVLKAPPALDAGSATRLTLSWPARAGESLDKQVTWLAMLLHWFGAVGGRSRNGWGSLQLFREDGKPLADLASLGQMQGLLLPLEDCLEQEWPAALGKDDQGPLVWWGRKSHGTWQEAMKELAEVKIAFRTSLPAGERGSFADRHLLAYPVTNHPVSAWGNQRRLANQLRFKVHAVQGPEGKPAFLPMAFHIPHRLPRQLEDALPGGDKAKASRQRQLEIWQKVHSILDNKMKRASLGRAAAAGGSHV